MIKRLPLLLLSVAMLSSLYTGEGTASEIYRWVGDDGVVHYSDTKPKGEAAVTTLQIEATNPKDYDPATNPYSVLNQAQRISRSWRELDARQEREEEREESDDGRYLAPPEYDPYLYYGPIAYFPSVPIGTGPRNRPRAARQQLHALEELSLVGRRPHSINSGAHRARVSRSASLPIVAPERVTRR
jgi:hypothetical protein